MSPGSLLRDQIQRKTDLADAISAYFAKGEYVPDSILVPLIVSRLNEPDCVLKGWVLDGFPKTVDHVIAMRVAKIVPSHVFFIECSDSLIYERNEERRLDPLTGIYYNLNFPPENSAIKNRLILLPEDSHEMVKQRLQNYKENSISLKHEFADICVLIEGKNPVSLISEKIADEIENNKSFVFR